MLTRSFWVDLSARRALLVSALGLALTLPGCGSGDSSGLNGDSGNGGNANGGNANGGNANGGNSGGGSGGSGGSAQGGSGGTDGGSSGTGAAGSGGLGGSDDGGASFGGSGGSASGGAAGGGGDAGEGGTAGAGNAGSGATGGSAGNGAGNISCGAEVCGLNQGQFCCQPQMAAPHCVTASNQCVCSGILCSTIELRCDGTEDCPGKICCYEKGVAAEPNIACAESCEKGITTDRAEICKLGVGGSCTKGGACQTQPGLPPGYGTCR